MNIFKNVAKLAENVPKNGPNWGKMDSRRRQKPLNDHNFGIFHPILKNEGTKMIYSARGIDWRKDLSVIYVRSKIRIFGHFWSKMALLGGQKIKILNFN